MAAPRYRMISGIDNRVTVVTCRTTSAGSGADAAYAWADTVSIFAEWMRVDLGSQSAETNFVLPIPPAGPGSLTAFGQSARSDVVGRFDVIQVGVNLKLY